MLSNTSPNAGNDKNEEKIYDSGFKMKPKILIADDDCDDTDFVTDVLKSISPDYIVWCFDNPPKAYNFLDELSDEELPCLIIIDFNLPPENGLAMLNRLKSMNRLETIPKVIYSGHLSPAEQEMCIQAGAVSCIQKSCSLDEVRKDVMSMLAKQLQKR